MEQIPGKELVPECSTSYNRMTALDIEDNFSFKHITAVAFKINTKLSLEMFAFVMGVARKLFTASKFF